MRKSVIIAFVALGWGVAYGQPVSPTWDEPLRAVTEGEGVRIKENAGLTTPVKGSLSIAETVFIVESDTKTKTNVAGVPWYKVIRQSGELGWVSGGYLRIEEADYSPKRYIQPSGFPGIVKQHIFWTKIRLDNGEWQIFEDPPPDPDSDAENGTSRPFFMGFISRLSWYVMNIYEHYGPDHILLVRKSDGARASLKTHGNIHVSPKEQYFAVDPFVGMGRDVWGYEYLEIYECRNAFTTSQSKKYPESPAPFRIKRDRGAQVSTGAWLADDKFAFIENKETLVCIVKMDSGEWKTDRINIH